MASLASPSRLPPAGLLLDALPEIAERIFASTANLLNLSRDIIFVDLLHLQASKLAAVWWAQERVAIGGCPTFDDDAAYAAIGLSKKGIIRCLNRYLARELYQLLPGPSVHRGPTEIRAV